ncbi:chaplin [Streptomyces sp. NPDC059168]|uniref:chaplin n=1 Tax=Streptomyces sp. NPDC059168 TaxID=3346753 RepID=UPI0036B1815F
MRSFATAAVLAGSLALAGTTTAHAADPGPTTGTASNSPGVLSGNVLQIPLDLGLNLCGNTVDVLALLNPAAGSICAVQ